MSLQQDIQSSCFACCLLMFYNITAANVINKLFFLIILIQWQKVLLRSIPWVVILYTWWKTKYTMSYLGLWRQRSYGNDTFHTFTSPLQLTLSTFQLLYCLDFSRKMWLNLSCAIANVNLTQFISQYQQTKLKKKTDKASLLVSTHFCNIAVSYTHLTLPTKLEV